jgi:hypothetical protein
MPNEKRNRQQEQDLRMGLQEVETSLPAPSSQPGPEALTRAIDDIAGLPFGAQLSVLRLVAPSILEALSPEDRERVIDALRPEISLLH